MKIAGIKLFGGKRGGKVAEQPDDDDEGKVAEHPDDDDEVTDDPDDDEVTDDPDDDEVADDPDDDEMPKGKAARKIYARGVRAGLKSATERGVMISQLCELAKKPARVVGKYIGKRVSVDDVREALLDGRASASAAAKISGLRNPTSHAKQIDSAAIWGRFNGAAVKARRH